MSDMLDKPMIATCRDPHHNGCAEWGWDGQRLYHRQYQSRYWTKVGRIHPTPQRLAALAALTSKQDALPLDRQFPYDELYEAASYFDHVINDLGFSNSKLIRSSGGWAVFCIK